MRWLRASKAVLVGAAILALASFSAAQDDNRFDVGLSFAGVFSKTSAAAVGGTTLKPTAGGGELFTVRYRFNHTHGIAVNIGHASNSQVFSIPPDTFRVKTAITEFSAAYVLSPFHAGRLDPFVFAGGGILHFGAGSQYIDGTLSPFGATTRSALTLLYGGGADVRVWKMLAVRVQYRGLIYKVPDFSQTRLFTGAYGNLSEPTAGLVFKF